MCQCTRFSPIESQRLVSEVKDAKDRLLQKNRAIIKAYRRFFEMWFFILLPLIVELFWRFVTAVRFVVKVVSDILIRVLVPTSFPFT